MHLLSSLAVLLASCAFAASAPVDCDIFGANCAGGGTGIADLFAQPGYDDSIDVAVNEISTNGFSSEPTVSPVVGNSDVSGLVSNDPIFNNVAENSDKTDDKQTSKKASFNRGYLTKFCDDTTARCLPDLQCATCFKPNLSNPIYLCNDPDDNHLCEQSSMVTGCSCGRIIPKHGS